MKSKKAIIILILIILTVVLIYLNLPREKILSVQECQDQGGHPVNIVAGATCKPNENKIGKINEFISPNICCIPKQIVGGCGTVTPGLENECCYKQMRYNEYPKCLGLSIFFNKETKECDFQCGTEPLACTEDARECPDGSWASRTSILNCSFIPCGYN